MFVGDLHADPFLWKNTQQLVEHFEVDAFVIVGDFGWWNDRNPGAREFENETGIPCYWIDGNHENFDHLYEFWDYHLLEPQETSEDIYWCPRGTILQLGRFTAMMFGGGTSVDKEYRVPRNSWWEQEKINQGEIDRALENWEDTTDTFIQNRLLVTHECPALVYNCTPELINETKVHNIDSAHDRMLLDKLMLGVRPFLHFHGHWHIYHNTDVPYEGGVMRSIGLMCDRPANFYIQNVGVV